MIPLLFAALFADTGSTGLDIAAPITGVTIGGAFVYLLTYHIPRAQREYAQALDGLTKQCGRLNYLLLLIAVSPDPKNDPAIRKAINDFAIAVGIKSP
jgi:hypothetical protein